MSGDKRIDQIDVATGDLDPKAPLGQRAEWDAEIIDDLQEVSFGVHEGTAMGGAWFTDWVDSGLTPEGGESFVDLRTRAVSAVTDALTRPAPVLVVAHGALFRALRAEMGLSPDVRTANGVPILCEPGTPWTLKGAI